MRQPLVPMFLTIAGAVVYQISSKSVPRGLHPLVAIIAAYVVAIAICLVAMWRWPLTGSLSACARELDWSVAGIGAGAALIEVGFLLSYRAGWPLNLSSVIVNVTAAVILMPLGFAMFDERLSVAKGLGATLCLV